MRKFILESLELRALFAGVAPDIYEQYLIALVNRARLDPAAEAARYGIDLNEGIDPASRISTQAKQPLAVNAFLDQSAIDHTLWMLSTGTFSHDGINGSTPDQRDAAAGYVFTGSYSWGENLAYTGVQGGALPDEITAIDRMYRNLFVDSGVAGRGHRLNILNGGFRETGAGIASGVFQTSTGAANAWMLSNEFAAVTGNAFLTGIIFADTLKQDGFYTPGEGFGNVTVEAKSTSTGALYSTKSWDAGGYSLQLPPGTYSVRAYGGDMPEPVSRGTVTIGGANVLMDMNMTASARGPRITADGTLLIYGLAANDNIRLSDAGDRIHLDWNAGSYDISKSLVKLIEIHGGTGDDYIEIGLGLPSAMVYGDAGSDTIYGGSNADTMRGGDGNDLLYGRGGNDVLRGGTGSDSITGGAGYDTLRGGDGNDVLVGGNQDDVLYGGAGNDALDGSNGNDTLSGDAGFDTLRGSDGNDLLLAADTQPDTLDGGVGTDRAVVDAILDTRLNIEL